MTQEHPITPPPELVQQWWDGTHGALYEFEAVTTQAARWGADQQLEQDARWLDTCALFSEHLTITPPGDALRQAMRPKSPSLKEQAQVELDRLIALIPAEGALAMAEPIRRALEALPND